jgi:diphthine-ammonia ligase
MKFVALVSGGKDSIYNIVECVRNGHELVACVHMGAPVNEQEESYMYQTAASEVMTTLVEECLGVPLILYERQGTSSNTSLVYEATTELDEVEDLYAALVLARERFPEIQAVGSGAILSTYQRVRIEHVCSRLNLTSLSFLWRITSQHELLKRMLDDGIVAVLVKTACPPGLVPQKHLHKTLGTLYASGLLEKLYNQYQFHMCGEGGEYESLVLDCPLYQKTLVLDEVEIVETGDGVGVLVIKRFHAEPKSKETNELTPKASDRLASDHPQVQESKSPIHTPRFQYLPHVRRMHGGLLHVTEIMSPIAATSRDGASEADLAVEEAVAVLECLRLVLIRHGATVQDVILVHMYLSEISHFAVINSHYGNFFGTLLPPSRSCVALGKYVLPGGRRVLLDCIAQCGSGQYMRAKPGDPYSKAAQLTTSSSLRQVLHVQSISYWAPICVGPYSQANTLRSGLHFLAGQIGLVPATMKLRNTWTEQLDQCWTNVARVLDALDGGSLANMLSCLVYVSNKVYCQGDAWTMVESICRRGIATNGAVLSGAVDSTAPLDSLYGGYEDEDTWREMTKNEAVTHICVPLLFVLIPEMPMGALAEVEVICSSQRASSCLEMKSYDSSAAVDNTFSQLEVAASGWDTGHDFTPTGGTLNADIGVNVSTRMIGHGCAAMAVLSATVPDIPASDENILAIDIEHLIDSMFDALFQSNFTQSSGLSINDIVYVRLYHIGALLSNQLGTGRIHAIDDGMRLRSSLHSALASRCATVGGKRTANAPACTVVPVQAMKVVPASSSLSIWGTTVLAMQALLADTVHMENEIWIHNGR